MLSKYAEQYAKEYGYQVVENISYDSETTNVTNDVQRPKNANPDLVMQASYINDAIREALRETNMPGDKLIMPWGDIRFDHETHQNTLGEGIICQIIDQEYYTVWPWNLATKELIWPMP